jgi:hypothetical protein
MVQIFQQLPDPGSQHAAAIGEGFGSGFSEGIKGGLAAQLSGLLAKKKEVGKVRTNLNSLVKRYGKDAFDPDTINGFESRAKQLLDQGIVSSADDATMMAIQERIQKNLQEGAPKEAPKSGLSSLFTPKEEASKIRQTDLSKSLKELTETLKGAGAKIAYPFVGLADLPSQVTEQAGTGIRKLVSLAQGQSEEEFQKGEDRFKKFAQEHPALSFGAGISTGPSLQESFLKATGGRGPGENPIERIIQGALSTGSPAGGVVQAVKEVQEALGIELPPAVQAAVEALTFVTAIKAGQNIKLPALKAGRKILDKAEKVAAEMGLKPEEVIQKATQESGADLGKALEGNAAEINKLNRKITQEAPGAEKVSKTQKQFFSPKEAIKQREAFGRKVGESPLAEYFKPEKVVEHRPETLAKQKEVTDTLVPKVERLEKQISLDKQDLRQMQLSRKDFSGNELARIESNIHFKENAIQRKMDELKDLRYELKYFRKRPTEAEIDAAVKKSADAYIEEAKNPTPEGMKKAERQLQLDKDYIESAEKILNRGELPGEIRPDTHIKMKQKYLDGYNAMIRTLKDEIKSLKSAKDVESLRRVSENQKAVNYLENRARRLKSDVVNQTDKIKAMRGLEGPSGAFYKHQLKDLHKDVEQFQKDFFKYSKEKSIKQQITEKSAAEPIKEVGKQFEKATKLGEEVAKNPTEANIQKVAEATGQNPAQVKQEVSKMGDLLKDRAQKLKDGKATENDVHGAARDVNKQISHWESKAKGVSKIIIKGFGVGVIKGIIENEFGERIPSKYISLGYTIFGKSGTSRYAGRFIGIGAGSQTVDYIYNKIESSKLKELRKNPNEYTKYIQELKKRYRPKRVNQIIEDSK